MTKTFKPVLLFHFSISVVLHSLPSHQPSYVCSSTICISNPIVLPFPSPTHAFYFSPAFLSLSTLFPLPFSVILFPSIPFPSSTFPYVSPFKVTQISYSHIPQPFFLPGPGLGALLSSSIEGALYK